MSNLMTKAGFQFDNSFARQLRGFYAPSLPAPVPGPRLLELNKSLAEELGLNPEFLASDEGVAILAGNEMPEGAAPLAQVYAGHQFGGFVPQLGDGRALLLGEVLDREGERRDIQLKGSGPTPFSRQGDGRASIGPVLREHLISEAMHALGIPTTRALASVATGEQVAREEMLPGAVLTRVAASHIRIGTFQFFSARGEVEKVKQLADYSIARHYPDLSRPDLSRPELSGSDLLEPSLPKPEISGSDNPYLSLLTAVRDAQARLMARWMLVGFVHGVMNTDNMTISGETIDYGPCAFVEAYDPRASFSSIDTGGRYAYGQQPLIARWNLGRFAETLLRVIDTDLDRSVQLASGVVNGFVEVYVDYWLDGMRAKLGLTGAHQQVEDEDFQLANDFLAALASVDGQNADLTLAFRRLSEAARGDEAPLRALLDDDSAYEAWSLRWRERLSQESEDAATLAAAMDRVNPIYIPRNHKVEEALEAAVEHQDLGPFEALLEVLQHPFDEKEGLEEYASPAPDGFGDYRTFCGT